jgi:hypothetical protein
MWMANSFEPRWTLNFLDKVYNNLKDWTWKISNKFDVGFFVFNVGIIRIIFIILLIRSNLSSLKFSISIFLAMFLLLTFF